MTNCYYFSFCSDCKYRLYPNQSKFKSWGKKETAKKSLDQIIWGLPFPHSFEALGIQQGLSLEWLLILNHLANALLLGLV